MDTKICSKCNNNKPLIDFTKRKTSKDGYRNQCKICVDAKKYVNPIIDRERARKCYQNNPEKYKEKTKQWRGLNQNKIKESNKKYRKDNVESIKEYKQNYKQIRNRNEKERKSNEPLYKLTYNIRNLLYQVMKRGGYKKNTKSQNILGCTFEEFKAHIESKFEDWMNWDNYGNWNGIPKEINVAWDIDHIIPISSASNEDEILNLNHYTNLQPLCSYTNRNIKRDNN